MEISFYPHVMMVSLEISKPYKTMPYVVVIKLVISNVSNYHINDLHQAANIVLVDKRRDRQILTCIWRNINKGFIKTKVPQRYTRATEGPTIYLPVPRTEVYKKSVFYYGSSMWNNLPLNVRMQDDIDSFKNLLYKHLL